MRRSALLAWLFVALLLIPIVPASHNMGHRYLVVGRILDSNGMPVQQQDVTITLYDGDTLRSSIIATTNCLGDFESWQGRRGTQQGNPPHAGGEIEQVPAGTGRPAYVNFHFHDPLLSDQLDFEFKAANETWLEGFVSKERQTITYRQLGDPVAPAASCGGFDQFNTTFTTRVFIAAQAEMDTAETPVKNRTAKATYEGQTREGFTDFMSTFRANFNNTTVAEGRKISIDATDIGSKSLNIDAEAMKFHRVDGVYVIGGTGGNVIDDFKVVGILILIVGLGTGLYFANKTIKAKREESRLRQSSTRRRFRKERGGEPPQT